MADKKYIGKPGKQDDPCWKGYEMVGMKKKGGRKVPNCVPESVQEIIEKAKKKSKKDWTGAKIDKDRFILPEDHENCGTPDCCGTCDTAVKESSDMPWHEDPKNPTRKTGERKDQYGNKVKNVAKHLAKKAMKAYEETDLEEKWMVKKGTEVVSTHKTKDEADVKAMKHPLYKVYAKEEAELEEKRGLWDNIHAKRKRIKAGSGERMRKPGSKGAPTAASLKASQTEEVEIEEAYGMWKVDFPKQHAGKAVAAGSVHVKAQNTAHAHKVAAKRVGVDHKVFKSKVTKSSILPEEVEELTEISAKGAAAREKFRARIQKVLADPKAIAKAKKTLAKKKEAEANAPKNLVHQLHKSQSINAKVKFYDGKEHEIAPNHHDKFMNKYHGLKSSIEKEALVKRAHKSHEDFLKAIHEESCYDDMPMIGDKKPCTCDIEGPNYPTPPVNSDILDYNEDSREDEYDDIALENDVAAEIDSSEWEDLSQYYEDDDLEEEDDEEELDEAITPQGRLKKKFNAMRSKSRRNMARNLALKRVATPDRIKSRSVRAARNMVYKRMLRGRDRSTLSSTERSRIEAQVKRMAPTVARLSIRLQTKERQIDRKRITNRNKRKK